MHINPISKFRRLTARFLHTLEIVCAKPLAHHKAKTLRKRLIPGAREHTEVFTFIRFDGPATNNHSERSLRPLVIFRKVCMGTRIQQGSRNIAIFNSLVKTAKLQKSPASPRRPSKPRRLVSDGARPGAGICEGGVGQLIS